MDLERIGTEERVGDFRADIFAKELVYGKTVIIENQLEESNHKHLGQIITYAAGKEAGCIIWIVKRAREEHAKAIEWLNSHLDQSVDLFLIEIELWRIGDSKIAPKFNIIEKPNQWGKEQKEERLESAAGFFRKNFWSAFCDVLSSGDEYRRLFTWGRPSSRQHFDLRIGSSKGHVYFSVSSQKKELLVALNTIKKLVSDSGKLPENSVIHSDRGGTYTSETYIKAVKNIGARPSYSRSGRCLDNASMESFYGHMKSETFYRMNPRDRIHLTRETAREIIADYVRWYNTERIQRSLGYLSPEQYKGPS